MHVRAWGLVVHAAGSTYYKGTPLQVAGNGVMPAAGGQLASSLSAALQGLVLVDMQAQVRRLSQACEGLTDFDSEDAGGTAG
jgi:hypothetical protein